MFIKAKETGKRSVTYWDKDGSTSNYQGGNRTWRNQNPGNIGAGPWTEDHGAIGKAGGFAVFPNYETGRAAIFSLLNKPDYKNQSIWDAIPHYAPAKENNVAWYRNLVHEVTGLDLDRKIKNLTKKEFIALVDAIERAEGKFKIGKIVKTIPKDKISAVRKNKQGTIISYFVKNFGWLSKGTAIQLAKKGKIDAVVTYSRSGSVYLKSRPDGKISNNLGRMG